VLRRGSAGGLQAVDAATAVLVQHLEALSGEVEVVAHEVAGVSVLLLLLLALLKKPLLLLPSQLLRRAEDRSDDELEFGAELPAQMSWFVPSHLLVHLHSVLLPYHVLLLLAHQVGVHVHVLHVLHVLHLRGVLS